MVKKHKLCAIACVDNNNAIGFNNKLLIHSKRDLKNFKDRTIGSVVVMGGDTFRSLPNGIPLANRTNIVLSSKLESSHSNMIVCKSMDALHELIDSYLKTTDVFVMGGESLYNEFQDDFEELCLTYALTEFPNADRYFPLIAKKYNTHILYDYWIEDIDDKKIEMTVINIW